MLVTSSIGAISSLEPKKAIGPVGAASTTPWRGEYSKLDRRPNPRSMSSFSMLLSDLQIAPHFARQHRANCLFGCGQTSPIAGRNIFLFRHAVNAKDLRNLGANEESRRGSRVAS